MLREGVPGKQYQNTLSTFPLHPYIPRYTFSMYISRNFSGVKHIPSDGQGWHSDMHLDSKDYSLIWGSLDLLTWSPGLCSRSHKMMLTISKKRWVEVIHKSQRNQNILIKMKLKMKTSKSCFAGGVHYYPWSHIKTQEKITKTDEQSPDCIFINCKNLIAGLRKIKQSKTFSGFISWDWCAYWPSNCWPLPGTQEWTLKPAR